MAADSVKTIPSARRIGMTWMILCLAGSPGVGFFGIAYFANNPGQAGPVDAHSERVFIELASLPFNPGIAGGLLSAIPSSEEPRGGTGGVVHVRCGCRPYHKNK